MTHLNILITGATSGIGRIAAIHLAKQGHRVFATGRNPRALAELEQEGEGLDLHPIRLDVTDADSIDEARGTISLITEGYGVDVLVNNAGYGHFGPMELVTPDDLRAQFETNVVGLMAVTRAFLPAMHNRGRGRVINVSSVGGRVTMPFGGAYQASKYAVESISDALRLELAAFGIQVVVVEPGVIRTDFANRAQAEAQPYLDRGSPYDQALQAAQAVMERADRMGADPMVIASVIERAATARRPRARYVAPFHGKLTVLLGSVLPTWLMDWAMRQAMGLGVAPAQEAPAPAVA